MVGHVADLPIVITGDEHVPLYMQLVHQFRHLITSRQIAADDRLPSVRELAAQLGVNSGTVSLAYRMLQQEGLIESRRGRGTFVAPLPDEATLFNRRQELLSGHIDRLIGRAHALGFDASTVKQYLAVRMERLARVMPIVVLMPSLRTSAKYAPLIAESLPRGVMPEPVLGTIDQVSAGDATVLGAYYRAYFTFTFMSAAPTVSALLARYGVESEVVGVTAQLTEETKARLRALDPQGSYCLVGESRNVASAVNLLARYSPIDVRKLPILTELSTPEQHEAVKGTLHIHNLGAVDQLDRYGVTEELRLQLEFTLSDESRQRLRRLLDAEAGTAWADPDYDFVG
jgi:GntR family transcriptional regulator